MRICMTCHENKDDLEFTITDNPEFDNGLLVNVCNACIASDVLYDYFSGNNVVSNYRKKLIAKRHRIPAAIRREILTQYNYTCRICGTTENLHIDHIIPVTKGGLSTSDNLQVLCSMCNNIKKNKDIHPQSYVVGYPIMMEGSLVIDYFLKRFGLTRRLHYRGINSGLIQLDEKTEYLIIEPTTHDIESYEHLINQFMYTNMPFITALNNNLKMGDYGKEICLSTMSKLVYNKHTTAIHYAAKVLGWKLLYIKKTSQYKPFNLYNT